MSNNILDKSLNASHILLTKSRIDYSLLGLRKILNVGSYRLFNPLDIRRGQTFAIRIHDEGAKLQIGHHRAFDGVSRATLGSQSKQAPGNR